MSTEEAHRFELLLDNECDRWLLHDSWTESKLHLEQGTWELHIDDDTGHAYVCSENADSLWCVDLFDTVVAPHPHSQELYVLMEDGSSLPLETHKQKHTPVTVPLMVQGSARATMVKAYLLQLACGGAYVWWSLADLYKVFITTTTPPHRWYQNWWQWWCKTVSAIGLDSNIHLRKPVPIGQDPKGELCHRIFPEASASSYALVMLLCRWANTSKSRAGQQKKVHQDDWLLVFKGFIQTFVKEDEKMEWAFFLDRSMSVRPGLPLAGANKVHLPIENACVDLSPLSPCDDVMVSQSLAVLDGIDCSKPVPVWQWCLALERAGTKCLWLWQQLVWYLGILLDGKVLGQSVDDGKAVQQDLAEPADMLVSQRQRQQARKNCKLKKLLRPQLLSTPLDVNRRLLQYFFAMRELLQGKLTVHVAFDASRVGNKQRLLGMVSCGNVCAYLPPQVLMGCTKEFSLRMLRRVFLWAGAQRVFWGK